MPAPKVSPDHIARAFLILVAGIGWLVATAPFAAAQVNTSVNQSVWQMLFGVSNAQINNPSWLTADDDGDGMTNAAEMIAGTNPFQPSSRLGISTVSVSGSNSSVSFPTVAGKLYTVQGSTQLKPTNWQTVAGVAVVGDGTIKTLNVANSFGPYFHVVVQDQSSANDQVSDWAKMNLGYNTTLAIGNQSIYQNATALATALSNSASSQSVVTVVATDASAAEPPNASTVASNAGAITINRSGYPLFSTITVPIQVTGTAISGTDYGALPSSVTFKPGVNSVTLNITPLYNANRSGGANNAQAASTTVIVTAQAGSGYTLGTPASANVTIYPPTYSGAANGAGLLGNYYVNSSATYSNAQTLGAQTPTPTYAFTQTTSTSGNVVVSYAGAPAVPFTVGSQVFLTFNTPPSGALAGALNGDLSTNPTEWNTTIAAGAVPTQVYTVSAVGANNFTVPITTSGISLPSSGPSSSSNVTISVASPGVVTWSNHGLKAGTLIVFSTNGSLPTGLTAGTAYYVISTGLQTNSFEVSTTPTGSAVNTSGTQSGTQTASAMAGTVTVTPFAAPTYATNFGGIAATNYNYTKSSGTSGTAVITYAGTPAVPFATSGAGSTVSLQFTSGNLYTSSSSSNVGVQPGMFDGTYNITAVGSQNFTVAISGTNLPPSGTGSGTITPFNAPVISEVDPTVNFFFGTAQPGNTSLQTGSNQDWAARWSSYVVPPATGTYTFEILANDGARVYVNGNLIINAWAPGSATSAYMASAGVALTQNVPALIQVEYYHLDSSTGSVDFLWEPPGSTSYTDIPYTISYLTSGLTTNGWSGLYWTNVGGNEGAPTALPVTITAASPAVVSYGSTPHNAIAGTPVIFSANGATLPTGITAGATYYVSAAGLTSTQYEISTAPGGTPVNTGGSPSGTPTAQTLSAFYGQPHYGDYPPAISDLSWSSQPSAAIPGSDARSFSIRWDGYYSPGTSTATISIASPAVVTWTAHGLAAGTPVVFSTTGALPTGLTAGTTYYVLAAGLAANTFEVSTTNGGSPVVTTGSQSGTQTASIAPGTTMTFDVQASDGARVYLDYNQSGTLTKIIDAWTADSSATTPITSNVLFPSGFALTAGQQYHIRIEYYQGGSQSPATSYVYLNYSANGGASYVPIPAASLFRADALSGAGTTTAGLWAQFYGNTNLTDPPIYATQDTASFQLANGGPYYADSVPAGGNLGTGSTNNWSGKLTTYLKATPGAGNYQFQLTAQSAGQLVIDGAVVLPYASGTITSSALNWTANSVHSVEVDFFDTGSNGEAILAWNLNGGSYTTIPAASFFADAGGTQQPAQGSVTGNFWTSSAFTGYPAYVDYQTQINYNKTTGEPGDAWGNTAITFSAAWDGYLSAASTGSYLFSLQAQSQARVYVNGTLVVDGWTTPGSSAITPITGSISLTAGTRVPFHVDFSTGANPTTSNFLYLLWQPPTAGALSTMPNNVFFRDATTSQQGLLATYYNNTTQTAPYFYQVQENNNPELDYTFGYRPAGLPQSNFTVRWTGQVVPQYTEAYYFYVTSDDGCRLWINDQLVINKWQSQGATEWISPPINLNAGAFYDIKLEYIQVTGNAQVALGWYSPDQAAEIIPQANLFTSTSGSTNAGPPVIASTTSDTYAAGSGTYTYTIAGSPGSTYSASGLPPGLTLTGNVISGTPAAGSYQFIVTATNAAGATSSTVVNLNVSSAVGTITREIYNGLGGPSVLDLQQAILGGTSPSSTDTNLTTLEDTTAYGNNTGERLRGYFTAPTTGNYYFWIAGSGTAVDSNHTCAELWISNTSQPVSNVRRAYITGSGTGSRVWNAQSTQESPWLSLVGGQQYYFEVLHNTGPSGSSSNLSVAWFLDPTGTTANPIANGAGPGAPSAAGIVPTYVLNPWNNPPTTTTPSTIYIADLAGSKDLTGISGSGGAYIAVNGTSAIVHLNYSGLTSGAIAEQMYSSATNPPTLIYNLPASATNTSDGGYTWSIPGSVVTALQSGQVFLAIATVNNPITTNNPYGELTGTFGKASGSQTPPSLPAYSSFTDDHATTAGAARFLTQATFGPSPTDIAYVNSNGFRTWIENQFSNISPTYTTPYVLSHLSNDPQNPYNDPLFFNAWWKNSVTASDQLRQRVAFALSEIMVTSDVGALNNQDRYLSSYYDTLVQYAFTNTSTILYQVSLTPAMGAYLNMQGNPKGNYVTGLHPNENYAREIMQLFSIGLYRLWPDGSLMLDNTGSPIPTYGQSQITGMARVFTGWNWGQSITGGRLPTNFGPAVDYIDPMVLVPNDHELGTKIILDNILLPGAVVTSQSDTTHDPNPNPIAVQTVDPVLGQGNLDTTNITSTYDLDGLQDFQAALNAILNNASNAPFICRQLIQRLVTSNPSSAYVYRVVRAYTGVKNVDGNSTGVIGDMKDTIRAILLDPEARNTSAAQANTGFGKEREPLLRVTGPARTFPPTAINCTYRQNGGQIMLITTPSTPLPGTPHRLSNNDTVLLDTFVDSGNSTTNLPYPLQGGYTVSNTTPSYNYVGATKVATVNAPGFKAGDTVNIQFTSGSLGTTSPYNTVQNYTVATATSDNSTTGSFTVNITGGGAPGTNTSGNAFTPNNFTINASGFATPSYSIGGTGNTTVTVSASGFTAGQKVYVEFTSGSLLAAGYDGVFTVQTAGTSSFTITLSSSPSGTTGGSTLIPTQSGGYTVATVGNQSTITLQTGNNWNLIAGDQVWVAFNTGAQLSPLPAQSGLYTVTGIPAGNLITITSPTVLTAGTESTNGQTTYPLALHSVNRSGTCTLDMFGDWNVGLTTTNSTLDQSPLNSTTVFNFFYPGYSYPGAIAKAGMTTPEFQLTDASDTMNLTNTITTGILQAGNANGFTSFFNGSGNIVLDLGNTNYASYVTAAQTADSNIATLVSQLGNLLTGGYLSSATQTQISNFVANDTNFPLSNPPTNQQMSNRVRAIIQLILVSAEYAIQK